MANLAQIAGLYTFLLFGADGAAASTFWVTFVGVIWIAVMTMHLLRSGSSSPPALQWFLLAAEIITLAIFAVVALIKVYGSQSAGESVHPSRGSWLNPFDDQHRRARSSPACSSRSSSTGAGTGSSP